MAEKVIEVIGLKTYFYTFGGRRIVKAVDGVDFSVEEGQALGLVGESGCGKTVTCLSIVRLLPPGAMTIAGQVNFRGEDLVKKSPGEMRRVLGKNIGMILQDPLVSLNPLFSIGDQVGEPVRLHSKLRGRSVRERVIELLRWVRIGSPEVRVREFPHQMSGGMRQRIVGAISFSGGPGLLIADEPTTNLDVTTQAQYLNLLRDIQKETGVAIIFVTHNIGIVAKMCQNMAVMYAGKIMEKGDVRAIFNNPLHPYTKALWRSIPQVGRKDTLYTISGQPPDLSLLPPGCSFAVRCAEAEEVCRREEPPERYLGDGRYVRCWLLEGVKK